MGSHRPAEAAPVTRHGGVLGATPELAAELQAVISDGPSGGERRAR
jgi:hypothetical protein